MDIYNHILHMHIYMCTRNLIYKHNSKHLPRFTWVSDFLAWIFIRGQKLHEKKINFCHILYLHWHIPTARMIIVLKQIFVKQMKHKEGEQWASECINTTERLYYWVIESYLTLCDLFIFPIKSDWCHMFHRMLLGNIFQFTNHLVRQSEKIKTWGIEGILTHIFTAVIDKKDPDRISTLTSGENNNWEVTLIWLCNLKTKQWIDKQTHTQGGGGWEDRNRGRKRKYTEGISLTNYRMVITVCMPMCVCLFMREMKNK